MVKEDRTRTADVKDDDLDRGYPGSPFNFFCSPDSKAKNFAPAVAVGESRPRSAWLTHSAGGCKAE